MLQNSKYESQAERSSCSKIYNCVHDNNVHDKPRLHNGLGLFCTKKGLKAEGNKNETTHYLRSFEQNVDNHHYVENKANAAYVDMGLVYEDEENKICQTYKKKFSRRKDMARHQKTCGEHKCIPCNRVFADAINSERHRSVHLKVQLKPLI